MSAHHLILLGENIAVCVLSMFIGFCWGKGKSALEGTPLGIWIGAASSAFIGGFIEGAPVGSTAGGGLAAFSGNIHADLSLKHVAIELLFFLAAPVGSGLADVRNFVKSNSFPNVFLGNPAIPLVSGKPETAKEA